MGKRLLYASMLFTTLIFIVIGVLFFTQYRRKEKYEDDKTCSLAQYITSDGSYSNDPDDDNYWLKQQSSSEQQVYNALMKEATDAEANGNTSDASVLKEKIQQLQAMRLNLRTKALDALEQSIEKRERQLDPVPKNNSCTVKSNPLKIFEITGNACSIGTVIGTENKIYTFPDILKPTKPDNIFTTDNVDSCYITVPEDVSIDTALVMVLNVLDAIGEKLNASILNDINKIIEQTRSITHKTNLLRNVTIPKTKQDLQNSMAAYIATRDNLNMMRYKDKELKSQNKILEDTNKQYDKEIQDIVEIYEHCSAQGKKYILQPGFTSFTGSNAKYSNISSIYFNNKKGMYLVVYDKKYTPYTIKQSINCLTSVNIGRRYVNLNDNIIAIELIKSAKQPSNSFIVSGANQKKVLDVSGVSQNNLAPIHGWDAHGGKNQKWTYNKGNKNITSVNSGKCIDAYYGGTQNYTKIIQYQCHGGTNQKWDFLDNGLLRNVNAQKCLQADPKAIDNNGFNVYLYDCDPNSQYQQWSVVDDLSYMKK
jgi:Ricin-type beta-trefoil lectin domain